MNGEFKNIILVCLVVTVACFTVGIAMCEIGIAERLLWEGGLYGVICILLYSTLMIDVDDQNRELMKRVTELERQIKKGQ